MTDSAVHRLFSYGTLQQRAVQIARFGRELNGRPDTLPGYRVTLIEITDPAVIATSGSDRHPLVIASTDPEDAVDGQVFELTEAELTSADEYEVDDYARVRITLRSGLSAWAYLSAG